MSLGSVSNIAKDQSPEHMVEFREAMEALKNEYPDKAVVKLRRALDTDKDNPYYISFLGLSIARAEKNWNEACELCERAVQLKRREIQFHMNLIEVHALAGRREEALHALDYAFRQFGNDARLKRARNKLIKRRAPVFAFLERTHFLNRELGKLRHRFFERLNK